MSSPAVKVALLGGGIFVAGYAVSRFAASRPIGDKIVDKRGELRTQGAIGEAVKAGVPQAEAEHKIKKVETHGGDKGLKQM